MTTFNSKFEYCSSERTYSLRYNCTGALCSYLESYPTVQCTKDRNGTLTCSNGITCSNPSNYTATQTISQTGVKFERLQSVTMPDFCEERNYISDGTVKGSRTNHNSISGCTPKPWATSGSMKISTPRTILLLLLMLHLFTNGALALVPSPPLDDPLFPFSRENRITIPRNQSFLSERTLLPNLHETVDLLGEYYGSVLNKAHNGKGPLLEKGIICEVLGFLCEHGAYLLVNAATWEGAAAYIDGCTGLLLSMAAVEPPMELVALLGASTFCNWMFNEIVGPHLGVFNEMCKPVEENCEKVFGEKKTEAMFHRGTVQMVDLMGDPENCGQVGKTCPTGSSCVGGACTSVDCAHSTGSANVKCGEQTGCFCATDTSTNDFCVQDAPNCGQTIGLVPDKCANSDECPSGYICTVSPRCGNKICLDAAACLGKGLDSLDEPGTPSPPPETFPSETIPPETIPPETMPPETTPPETTLPKTTSTSTSPGATATTFPPLVIPATKQLSGWSFELLDGSGYKVSDADYFPPSFTSSSGKKTVNTVCIKFDELDEELPDQTIHSGVPFSFESRLTPNTDTCCLALFTGTECDPATGEWQHVCSYSPGRQGIKTSLVVKAFQVYNCKGLL